MRAQQYLERIKFFGAVSVDSETLASIHEHHVMHVPFENLDIHYKRPFNLDLESIYNKVVNNNRGGFCYELNYLFCELLKQLGFDARIISAQIYTDLGVPGPEFDHMAVIVKTDKEFLLDVGFGDLFIRPMAIAEGDQSDGRFKFRIEKTKDKAYDLLMSPFGTSFQKKYVFNLADVSVADFKDVCHDKQTSPESYFVRNTICTKPTVDGRVTIFNKRLIETTSNGRTDGSISDEEDLSAQLKLKFGIVIKQNN